MAEAEADVEQSRGEADVEESRGEAAEPVTPAAPDAASQAVEDRRMLRSRYLAVKSRINDEKDELASADSVKFQTIFKQVEDLYNLVQKPREQIADAEALLDIASSLVISVRSQSALGITPTDFVTGLLNKFGTQGVTDDEHASLSWRKVGLAASHVFMAVPGCCTMLGPMNTEAKPRKIRANRKRTARPCGNTCPEQLALSETTQTDTDRNMSVLFNILRKKKSARMENLVLNRVSFAQTVENVFALSFLVKDGRVEINVNDEGHHIVYPRNAPAASAIASGEVVYNHFVFRFDFKDWKLMKGMVIEGEELMQHRSCTHATSGRNNNPELPVQSITSRGNNHLEMPAQNSTSRGNNHPEMAAHSSTSRGNNDAEMSTTPIRKLCRNRAMVTQEITPRTSGGGTQMDLHLQEKIAPEEDEEMVKDRQETGLTYKRRRLFQD